MIFDVERTDVFPTTIYSKSRLDFLPIIQEVGGEYLMNKKAQEQNNPVYPMCQTDNCFLESRLKERFSLADWRNTPFLFEPPLSRAFLCATSLPSRTSAVWSLSFGSS